MNAYDTAQHSTATNQGDADFNFSDAISTGL